MLFLSRFRLKCTDKERSFDVGSLLLLQGCKRLFVVEKSFLNKGEVLYDAFQTFVGRGLYSFVRYHGMVGKSLD